MMQKKTTTGLKIWALTGWVIGLLTSGTTLAQTSPPQPVTIEVDLTQDKGPLDPIWAWFGYDEPNYTYMKDGKKLLTEISQLSQVPVNVRAHSLLVTGDGTAALK